MFRLPGHLRGALGARIPMAFGAVGLITLLAFALLGLRARQYVVATNRETERGVTLRKLSHVFSLLQDSETGERGYVITGDEGYLQPWSRAANSIPDELAALQSEFRDHAHIAVPLGTLFRAVLETLDFHASIVSARRTQGFDAAKVLLDGSQHMDRVGALITEIDNTERAEFAAASNDRRDAARQAAVVAAVMGLVLAGTVRLGAKEVRRQQAAQNALAEQNEALEVTQQQIRAVLDASSEAMLLVGTDGRFLTVNSRYEDFFGLSAEQVLGRSFADIARDFQHIFADPETLIGAVTGSARDRERVFTLEVEVLQPEVRRLLLHSTPIRSPGSPLARVFAFRDITKEREADRLKSHFVAMVSHELRTPLTSVKGYIDLLLDGVAGDMTEEQRRLLTTAGNNADRLMVLVGDLLEATRIEAGTLDVQSEPVDLRRVINAVVSELGVHLSAKHQTCNIDAEAGLPKVLGDRDRLHEILTNLVSNASKYSDESTSIEVRARTADRAVRVEVRDAGVGLSSAEVLRVFERFFRATNRQAGNAGGTGLGLSITRSLVELQGGTMWVESELGVGSTFGFSVPMAPAGSRDARFERAEIGATE